MNQGTQKPESTDANQTEIAITTESLSQYTKIPHNKLIEWGIKNRKNHIRIPYYNYDGTEARARRRYSLTGDNRFKWEQSNNGFSGILPYGRNRLSIARDKGYIIIVEGESDCWACWLNDVPALGVPGSTTAKCIELVDVNGIENVYVYMENDAAGREFPSKVKKRLVGVGYKGVVKSIRLDNFKDLNDAIKDFPSMFTKRVEGAIEKAEHISIVESIDFSAPVEIDPANRKPVEKIIEPHIKMSEVGNRNNTGYSVACDLRDNGYTELEALSAIEIYQIAVDDSGDPYTMDEAKNNVKSAYQEPAKPLMKKYALTEFGNAERFLDKYKGDIIYHRGLGWLVWNGKRWERTENEIYNMIYNSIKEIETIANSTTDEDERDRLLAHSKRSQSKRMINAVMEIVQNAKGIYQSANIFNQDHNLFNVSNGTIDLTTGELLSHKKENLCSQMSPIVFDPNAQCPIWLSFLDRIMAGDKEIIDFLQVAAGYSLTGKCAEKMLFFLYGADGDNGKSTFIETLMYVFGIDEYATKMSNSLLLSSRYGDSKEQKHEMLELYGKRMAVSSELSEMGNMNETLIKDMTGGDSLVARDLYKSQIVFSPTHTIWMYGNYKPIVRGTDNAIWSRIKTIPFDVKIPEAEQDKDLKTKLREEGSGILNWLLRGCLSWRQSGLVAPESVNIINDEYRREMDVVGQFIDDCCDTGGTVESKSSNLYGVYRGWCQANGIYVKSHTFFGRALQERGYTKLRKKDGKYYKGIRVSVSKFEDEN